MRISGNVDKQQTVREKVREGYAAVAAGGGSCCGASKSCCGSGDAAGVAKVVGYSDAELATLPEGAKLGDYVTSLNVEARKRAARGTR